MKQLQKLDKRLITILLIVFVQMMGYSIMIPILSLYAQREFALDERMISVLISAFFAAQFVAGPWLGRLSDQYGRVPILIVSQIGTVIAYIMIASAQSVPILFAARILDGVTGGNIIVAQAYITDVMPKERRTEALGYIMAASGVGVFFGPALGGVLSSFYGPRMPFWFAAVMAAIVVLITHITLDESLSATQRAANRANKLSDDNLSWGRILRIRELRYVLSLTFIFEFVSGMFQAALALWAAAVLFNHYTPSTVDLGIGLLASLSAITLIVTQTFFLRGLLERMGEINLLILSLITHAVGMLLLAIFATLWIIIPGIVLRSFGIGTTYPLLQSLATKIVPEEMRGGVLGYSNATFSLGTIFGTAIAGLLFEIQPTFQYWVGVGLLLIAMLISIMYREQLTTQKEQLRVG